MSWARKDDYHCGFSENTADDKPVFAKSTEHPSQRTASSSRRIMPREKCRPPRQRTSLTHVCPPPFPWLMLLPVTCRRDGLRSQRPPVISFARTAGVMLHPGICGRNCSPCDRLWSTSSRPFTNRAHIDSFDEWLTVLSIGVYYRLILLKSLFRSIVYDTSSIGLLLVACDVMW